jgi:hypothetical protein
VLAYSAWLRPIRARFVAFASGRAKRIAREHAERDIRLTVDHVVHDVLQVGHSAREVYGLMGDWPAVIDGRGTRIGELTLSGRDHPHGESRSRRRPAGGRR